MNYLKGLIKCDLCGKNYNYKPNNGQEEYLCQTRKNYGRDKCDGPIIKQQLLLDVIETHCRHNGKDCLPTNVKWFVKEIHVNQEGVKILFKDGTYSKITSEQVIF